MTSRVKQLQHEVVLLQSENAALRSQVQAVSSPPIESKIKEFYELKTVRLTRYTGFYDKDKDGRQEKLIVYVQAIDEVGDVVKAAGTVDVQLWDLSADPNRALLGAWHVGLQDLHKMWLATMVTINYRFVFDKPRDIPEDKPLTVKVLFTDALTGQVLTDQAVIKP